MFTSAVLYPAEPWVLDAAGESLGLSAEQAPILWHIPLAVLVPRHSCFLVTGMCSSDGKEKTSFVSIFEHPTLSINHTAVCWYNQVDFQPVVQSLASKCFLCC